MFITPKEQHFSMSYGISQPETCSSTSINVGLIVSSPFCTRNWCGQNSSCHGLVHVTDCSGRKKMNFFILMFTFPGVSAIKESACNAGDPGSIPGLGRSPGEGNGCSLQYSCLESHLDGGDWRATVHGITKESDMTYRLNHRLSHWQWMLVWARGNVITVCSFVCFCC